jgi:hypothetical protein
MNSNTLSIKSFAFFFAVAISALLGGAMLDANRGAQPSAAGQDIVKLERVVIVGKRSAVEAPELVIAQLPRVVITGRSTAATPDVQLASAGTKPAAKAL